jgi:hypothetical protein
MTAYQIAAILRCPLRPRGRVPGWVWAVVGLAGAAAFGVWCAWCV